MIIYKGTEFVLGNKRKKRVWQLLSIVLIVCAMIRIGNIVVLCSEDYSKINVYASSFASKAILLDIEGVSSAGLIREGYAFRIDFSKEYHIMNFNTEDFWLIMGALGIHDYSNDINWIYFSLKGNSQYQPAVCVDNDVISFCYMGESGFDYAKFTVQEENKVPIKEEYNGAMEEHAEAIDEMIIKARNIKEDYYEIMKLFREKAIFWEGIRLVLLSAILVISCANIRKMKDE